MTQSLVRVSRAWVDRSPSYALALVVILVLFGSAVTHAFSSVGAFGDELKISPLDPTVQAPAGRAVTTGVRVENTSDEPIELGTDVTLPSGWRLLIPPDLQVHLWPGEVSTLLLTVAAPADAGPGVYPLVLNLVDIGSLHELPIELTAYVRPVVSVDARWVEKPDIALGDSFALRFVVSNLGNEIEELIIGVEETLDYRFDVEPARATLKPGESVEVAVTARPGRAATERSGVHRVPLVVADQVSGDVVARAGAPVDFAPTNLSSKDAYHLYPLRLELGWSGGSLGGGFRWRLSGNGRLSEGGSGRLRLRVREERAFAEYTSDRWRIAVGDARYRLTPLTINGDLDGVGLDVARHNPLVSWRALAYAERDGELRRVGATVTMHGPRSVDVSLSGVTRPSEPGDLWSLRAAIPLGDSWRLETEYGRQAVAEVPSALWLTAAYERGAAFGRFEFRHEQDGYRERTDALNALAGVFVHPLGTSRLTVRTNMRQSYSPGTGEWTATAWDNSASVSGGDSERRWSAGYKMRLSTSKDEVTTWTHRLTGSLSRTLDGGRAIDQRAFADLSGAKGEAAIGYAVGYSAPLGRGRVRLAASARHHLPDGSLDGLGASVSLTQRIGVNRSLSLTLEAVDTLESKYRASLGFSSRVGTGQSLNLSLHHWWVPGGERETRGSIAFVMPFDLPIGRRSDVGAFAGRLLDYDGAGVSGAVVQIDGLSVVTDAEGRFEFPAVRQGEYLLVLRQSPIANAVTQPAIPWPVAIKAGQRIEQEFLLTQGGAIRGTIGVDAPSEAVVDRGDVILPSPVATVGGMRIVFQDAQGNERSAITSVDGAFRRDHVVPGRWRVTVDPKSVPEGYAVQPLSHTIEVAPGSDPSIEFLLVPVPRQIRFVDEQEL